MKKSFFFSLALIASMTASAQVTVAEPEFINSYCILTSDSTLAVLPKENGTTGRHQNKTKKITSFIGKVSDVASTAGILGIHASARAGSLKGVLKGAKATGTAIDVGRAADAVNGLAGAEGMDVIFSGGSSSYSLASDGGDIRLLIRGEKNDTDPLDTYRIVRFSASKKERRIQWMEFSPNLLGSAEVKKGGYVYFSGHKYGEQSYLLTIPASEIVPGEYGIFYMSIISATAIPVGTFSIKE
ncbi:MAG: hypothetical protein IJV33_06850 [Bacteroidaceae bacterium]|nr:hypothetical protein [Bacteroidaceae bacterium]